MRTPPSRTCLGCRRARPKGALVRLVRLPNGTVVVDPSAHAAGRGAYVCPEAACVERALNRGRLTHAFRKPCEAGPDLAAAVRAVAGCGAGAPPGQAGGTNLAPPARVSRTSDICQSDVVAVRA